MEYKILYDDNTALLAQTVQEHIEDGWRPQGGVAVVTDDVGGIFLQAMVRASDVAQIPQQVLEEMEPSIRLSPLEVAQGIIDASANLGSFVRKVISVARLDIRDFEVTLEGGETMTIRDSNELNDAMEGSFPYRVHEGVTP